MRSTGTSCERWSSQLSSPASLTGVCGLSRPAGAGQPAGFEGNVGRGEKRGRKGELDHPHRG